MKKLLCLLLSVCLIFSVLSIGASALAPSAKEPELFEIYVGSADKIDYDPTVAVETTQNGASTIPFYSNGTAQPFTFYAQLNDNQKAVYDFVLQDPLHNAFSVALAEPLVCTIPFPADGQLALPQEISDELMTAALGGLSALIDDHPEIFWITQFDINASYGVDWNADGTITLTIQVLSIVLELDQNAYASWEEVFAAYNSLLASVATFPVRGFTRAEKVKSIHDNIAAQVTYDTEFQNPHAHAPTSVFMSPYTTVCEGYAEAFQLLCQREGIPCITVVGMATGGGHAWNYVQMENGIWYAVDLTWDDQDGIGAILYDFFLVGSQSYNLRFGGNTFSSGHTAVGQRFTSDLFALSYPTLSTSAYCAVMGQENSDTAFNRAKGMLFIGKDQSASTAFVVANGGTVNALGVTTGATVSYSCSEGTGTYTLVRRGDINADNSTSRTDYNMVKETLSGTRELAAGSASEAAADLNGDGVVDAFDAALLDLYLNDIEIY